MDTITLFLIAFGLAMDAFAVSVANGSTIKRMNWKHAAIFGCYFGAFQFIMPLFGYFGTRFFSKWILQYNHWIAFILLAIIGGKMVWESFCKNEDEDMPCGDVTNIQRMLILAIATSIDAMAVGVTFVNINVFAAATVIGVVAFLISTVGVCLGQKIGVLLQNNAERLGGAVLIGIGVKMLLQV